METKIEAMQIFTCEKEGVPLHWKENAQFAFLEGVRFAEEWISVNEELPKYKIGNYPVLAKDKNDLPYIAMIESAEDIAILSTRYTHWRPINKK